MATRSVPAVKAWKFIAFAQEADAVLVLDLAEVAYAAASMSAYWPKISASMSVTSTRNVEIASTSYQVRFDPDTSDPRDLKPLAAHRFDSADQLLADPARAAQALTADLDRIVKLIARDVATLQRGQELKWEAV